MNAVITGTGSALPEKLVTNFDLETIMDTSDEWIRERTGICARHIACEETATSLAVEAAKKAIEDSGRNPEDIELILAASSTADHVFPCLACEVQEAIGAVNAGCFDINAACAGFISALSTAHSFIRAGEKKCILVVAVDVMSRAIDWSDRSSAVLFGDGSGAVIVEASEEPGIERIMLGADGKGKNAITCTNRTNKHPWTEDTSVPSDYYLKMDGKAVYQFAVTTVPKLVKAILTKEAEGEQEAEVISADWYLLHQANARMIQAITKRLKEPAEKFPVNVYNTGNLSAASIPVLLDETSKKGTFKKGERLVLAGFGAGLTYGAVSLIWGK